MSMRAWVSLSLAACVGVSAFACGPKAGGDRLPGARGIQDASQKMFDILCACEEGDDAEVCENPEGDPGYFGDADTACIDRVLADFPADRTRAQCQVEALYDLVECYEATGCPPDVVVASPSSDGTTQTPEEPEPTADPTAECEDEFSRAVEEDCGEISDDALLRLEEECDLGGGEECVAISENGETTDCSSPPSSGQSSPGCNPDIETCGSPD